MDGPMTRRAFVGSLASAGMLAGTSRARASLRGIDHIVIMFADLETAVRDYTDLGFSVVRGGSHPTGTHNALIAFADGAYIELIAFERPNPEHRWWDVAQTGGGFIDFCMQTDNLAADMAAFQKTGVEMKIAPGERVRPDGFKLSWVLAQAVPPHAFVAPFLIEDKTPREERVPREKSHPNGVTGIATVTVAVTDFSAPQRWWSSVLDQAGTDLRRDDLGASGVRFVAGPHVLEFLVPEQASPLSARIEGRGAGPWSLTLKATGSARVLDARKARARIELVR
jgi:catechol 2,3-dioxygenase-like lactoylglutathione lyase family enzyme